jgi:hypothetical protein
VRPSPSKSTVPTLSKSHALLPNTLGWKALPVLRPTRKRPSLAIWQYASGRPSPSKSPMPIRAAAPWQLNVEPFHSALEAPQAVKGVKLEPVDFET